MNNVNGVAAAVKGEINTQQSGFEGAAGVYGLSTGLGGSAGYFHASNISTQSVSDALFAIADGGGNALTAVPTGTGNGVAIRNGGPGAGIYSLTESGGNGIPGVFEMFNTIDTNPALQVITNSYSATALDVLNTNGVTLAVFRSGPGGNPVARIDNSGIGYFDGGTHVGGADMAEAFDVEGTRNEYEAGDVLIISTTADRTVTKSDEAYSPLVAGVYATKPGVMLTDDSHDKTPGRRIPMGVVGVIPTKVCDENGPVHRGDVLVSSSRPGYAMKADLGKLRPGQAIGKALEEFNGLGTGKIKVLVNVR